MARIHGVNTQYGSELGIYVQRNPDDEAQFANNWDRIFGKKEVQPDSKDNLNQGPEQDINGK